MSYIKISCENSKEGVMNKGIVGSTQLENGNEISFRLIEKGDKHGRNDCLIYNENEPVIEFNSPGYGLISSYYLSTFMESRSGINLEGSIPEFKISQEQVKAIQEEIFLKRPLNEPLMSVLLKTDASDWSGCLDTWSNHSGAFKDAPFGIDINIYQPEEDGMHYRFLAYPVKHEFKNDFESALIPDYENELFSFDSTAEQLANKFGLDGDNYFQPTDSNLISDFELIEVYNEAFQFYNINDLVLANPSAFTNVFIDYAKDSINELESNFQYAREIEKLIPNSLITMVNEAYNETLNKLSLKRPDALDGTSTLDALTAYNLRYQYQECSPKDFAAVFSKELVKEFVGNLDFDSIPAKEAEKAKHYFNETLSGVDDAFNGVDNVLREIEKEKANASMER